MIAPHRVTRTVSENSPVRGFVDSVRHQTLPELSGDCVLAGISGEENWRVAYGFVGEP